MGNNKFYEIESKSEYLFRQSKFFIITSIVSLIIGSYCIIAGTDEGVGLMVAIGYGLCSSVPLYGISLICQLLANILKIHVMTYKKSNNIPNKPKETLEHELKEPIKENFVGGVKLEDY